MVILAVHCLVRWHRSQLAETDASDLVSAACYRRIKHVGIEAVVVPELKLRDVERHIFGAHLVERTNDAPLEDAPEAFNRIRMHRADNVLLAQVIDCFVVIMAEIVAVVGCRVRRQQADLVRNCLVDESQHLLRRDLLKNARHHVTLALDRANDRRFALGRVVFSLIEMAVTFLAANPRLVHFYDAAQLDFGLDQRRADFVAHKMRCVVAAEAEHALDLQGAHSLLARKHQMGDAIPVAQRLLGVLENRPRQAREPIAVLGAFPALPVEGLIARGVVQVRVAAARAMHAFRPTPRHQVAQAGLVIPNGETGFKLSHCHLRDWFRALCHGGNPSFSTVEGYCHV